MKAKLKSKLAAAFVVFACLLFGALTGTTHTVRAGDGTAAKPLELPADRNNTDGGDSSEVCSWVKLETDNSDPKKPKAAKIRLSQKSHHKGNYYVDKGRDELRSVKITKITYTDGNEEEQTIDVTSQSTGGDTGNDDRTSDISIEEIEDRVEEVHGEGAKIDWTKKIKICYEHRGANGAASGTQKKLKVNWGLRNDEGKAMCVIDVGPGATVATASGASVGMTTFLTNRGLAATDYVSPDVMFFSRGAPEVGEIRFVPMGYFSFTSLPDAVHMYDSQGTDLILAGDIELGSVYLSSKGELVIPVTHIEQAPDDFILVARDSTVQPDDDSVVHGYTVGGSAVSHLTANAAVIADGDNVLNNWQVLQWSPDFSLARTDVPVWDDVQQSVVNQRVGVNLPEVVAGEENQGFLSAFVVRGNSTGSIGAGDIVLRPVHGFQFVEHESTKLYVLNAATGADVSSEVTANLSVSSAGFLNISLDDLGNASGLQLDVVVVNPQVSYNAPIAYGYSYELNVYGTALGSAMQTNLTLLEGDLGDPLPDEPWIDVHGWTPAATMD